MNGSKGGFRAKAKRDEQTAVGIPSNDVATIEGLIDLLIIKGIITEDELKAYADKYGAILNGLLDLLNIKGVISEVELEIARSEYHRFIQAVGANTNIPPAVLFERRRNVIIDRLKLEEKIEANRAKDLHPTI